MSKQANPSVIGVFVIGALLILVLGLTAFSSGQWLTKKSKFVLYFDESVNGLSVGALVKMQGVPIGKVIDIQVQLDPLSQRILTPVFIEIDHQKCSLLMKIGDFDSRQEAMTQLIKDGLRMQLQYTSLVTGQLYVETSLRPETKIKLMHLNDEYIELASVTSSSQEVQKNITEAIREIQNIPFQNLSAEFILTLKNINQLVNSDELRQSLHSLASALKSADGILKNINQKSKKMTADAEGTLHYSHRVMKKIDGAVEPLLEELPNNMNAALEEVRRSAQSLRLLADYLEQHPESLIKGKR